MLKAIKIRLYPDNIQKDYINNLLGSYRLVYNLALNNKINAYSLDKANLGLSELGNYFHNDLTKDPNYHFLNEHNTKVLKQSIINLLDAYKNFFKQKTGFPKFKSRKDNKQSCRFPIDAISKSNDYSSNYLTLTKQLKNIEFRCSNYYHYYLNTYKSGIKSATLTKNKSGNYYLSILIEGNIDKELPKSDKIIGIDLGIKDFIVTSDNERYVNIKSIRNNEKKLKRLQRSLSNKQFIKTGEFKFSKKYNKDIEIKKPSKNREKARIKLAKFHEKLTNIKENYLHSIVNKLLSENQTIVIEDLSVSNMIKNHKLARSIQELSLYRFKQILLYKSEMYGKEVIIIDRFFPSSKLCSLCGYKNNDLKLRDREWLCPHCGQLHDRDLNASLNIKNEGIRIKNSKIGDRITEFKSEEIR